MAEAPQGTQDAEELRQELMAHRVVLASLATQLIINSPDKHAMLEQVFTDALDQVDEAVAHDDPGRDQVISKVHELADLVQHGR